VQAIHSKKGSDPFSRERRTLGFMVQMYCRDRHRSEEGICPSCRALLEYALARLSACPFGAAKPVCSKCAVHCYRPAEREMIREVMRHSGPRMVREHPWLAFCHALDGFRPVPRRAG